MCRVSMQTYGTVTRRRVECSLCGLVGRGLMSRATLNYASDYVCVAVVTKCPPPLLFFR